MEEAALIKKIEELERELAEAQEGLKVEMENTFYHIDQLAAEKALADRLHSSLENEVIRSHMPESRESQSARSAYRKARGM